MNTIHAQAHWDNDLHFSLRAALTDFCDVRCSQQYGQFSDLDGFTKDKNSPVVRLAFFFFSRLAGVFIGIMKYSGQNLCIFQE